MQSKYFRQQQADFQGFVSCYTCNVRKHWKEMDLAHYIHNRLDFEPNNLRVCCVRCNRFLHGNLGIYGEKLIREVGLEAVEKMRLYSYKKGNNYTVSECKEVITKYKST